MQKIAAANALQRTIFISFCMVIQPWSWRRTQLDQAQIDLAWTSTCRPAFATRLSWMVIPTRSSWAIICMTGI